MQLHRFAIAILLLSSAWPAAGQSLPQFDFEVASVKPSDPNAKGRRIETPSGGLRMTNVTLKDCVRFAFGAMDHSLFGGPPWFDSQRFDIEAKFAAAQNDAGADPRARAREALKTLLERRFQFRSHRETRVLPLYELTVAKSGFKLKETDTITAGTGVSATATTMRWTRRNSSMASLTLAISSEVHRPVEDKTGIAGSYSFVLEWERPELSGGSVPAPGDLSAPNDAAASSIGDALQRQLGLSLKLTKGPVEVLVIDSAALPSSN